MSLIYNRRKQRVEDCPVYKNSALEFLYNNALGRIVLKAATCPTISKIYGKYNDTKLSTRKIEKFIKDNKINMNDFENREFKSFNDFFTREKLNLSFDVSNQSFISPADSKLTAYKISKDLSIKIKKSVYTLNELLGRELDYSKFEGGNCLVFRLSVDDYHRYCFIDNGTVSDSYAVKGKLHTVSPVSENFKIYSQNSRVCSFLNTENFGDIIYIEVGALMVGKIVNHNVKEFHKGQEKGYFEFGGSTVVVLTTEKIKIDEDIIKYSLDGIETRVLFGETVGKVEN